MRLLSRPNMRPWTGVRAGQGGGFAVFWRVRDSGARAYRTVHAEALIPIRRGSDRTLCDLAGDDSAPPA